MKRTLLILAVIAAMLLCSACAPLHLLLGKISPEPDNSMPNRLVQQIEVCTINGSAVEFATYTTQEQMSPILRLLRDMSTDEEPEEEVTTDSAQGYYAITTTYVNGQQNNYELMSGLYFREGNQPWYLADTARYTELAKLLAEFAAAEEEATEATAESTGS